MKSTPTLENGLLVVVGIRTASNSDGNRQYLERLKAILSEQYDAEETEQLSFPEECQMEGEKIANKANSRIEDTEEATC